MNTAITQICLRRFAVSGLLAAGLVVPAPAQEVAPPAETLQNVFPKPSYSPYAGRNFPTRVYWGDTHLHTAYSFDAGAFGARLNPMDAYRFARGEELTSSTGQRVKLSRRSTFWSLPITPTTWEQD